MNAITDLFSGQIQKNINLPVLIQADDVELFDLEPDPAEVENLATGRGPAQRLVAHDERQDERSHRRRA